MGTNQLNHFDEQGNAVMVDVTDKAETERCAVARGSIYVTREIFDAIAGGTVRKGDVLGTARLAGILAAKQTPHLIPLCHPLLLSKASVDFELHEDTLCVDAVCTVKLRGQTGVEMEALRHQKRFPHRCLQYTSRLWYNNHVFCNLIPYGGLSLCV